MRQFIVSALLTVMALFSASAASAQTATQDINLTATVASYCTIGGVTGPAALSRTVAVTNGVVTVTPINITVASVACNNTTNVIATSVSGGITTGVAPVSGATNIINYIGVATFNGASSTINTATVATAAASEAGNTASATGAATGNLTVTITPVQPSLPLTPSVAYADTLRVTLTAQ